MVFKNNIYSGNPEGFFSFTSLNAFLKGLPEITESIYDEKHGAQIIGYKISGTPIYAFYHFRIDENNQVVQHLEVYSLTPNQGLGKIEKLILEQAKKTTPSFQ